MPMKNILSVSERATVEEVVRSVRDAGISVGMSMMALEIAQEILVEEHEILVSLERLSKVRVAA